MNRPTARFAALRLLAALAALIAPLVAQDAASKEALRRALGDFGVDESWVWGDWNIARSVAAKEGKPIFLVFRCVP